VDQIDPGSLLVLRQCALCREEEDILKEAQRSIAQARLRAAGATWQRIEIGEHLEIEVS